MSELLGFGKFKRKGWHEVSRQYLEALIDTGHKAAGRALDELARRELEKAEEMAAMPEGAGSPAGIYVSSHAVDRASLRLLAVWEATRRGPTNPAFLDSAEGLHSWLLRMAGEAVRLGLPARDTTAWYYQGIRFVFAISPSGRLILKSVMADQETLSVNHPAEANKLEAVRQELVCLL